MSVDLRTFELRQLRPRLRDGVTFTLQRYGDVDCYVVEDESQGTFFRIGLPEYMFVSLLDGRTTVGEALAYVASQLGGDAFDERQAASICRWLVENKLTAPEQGFAHRTTTDRAEKPNLVQRLNPLSVRIPFGSPQDGLISLEPLFGGLFSVAGFVMWCLVLLAAVWQVVPHSDSLWRDSAAVLSPHNWFWVAVWGLGLKVLHELAHGVACVRFGGRVREAGVVLLLLLPIPYVDLTSTWRLPKWQRMVTSAAGMYAELLIAALAAIAWANTRDEFLRQQLLQVMLTASVVTVLFNANPLMRFDGYYILSDGWELPNLAVHAQQLLSHAAKHWLLGIRGIAPEWPEGRAWLIAMYGVASAIWRTLVSVTLIVASATWFEGVGLLLSVTAVFAWFVQPLWRALRFVLVGSPFENPNRTRFGLIMSAVVVLGVLIGNHVPARHSMQLAGVVEYVDAAILHAQAGGFVDEVLVESGQAVQEGDLLLRLSNPELALQMRELHAEVARSELRSRMFQQNGELAAMAVEDDNRASLRTKLVELSRLSEALEIRAPRAGVIAAGDLSSLQGTFVSVGQELLVVGDPREKEIRVLISQEQWDAAPGNVGREASIHIVDDSLRTVGTLTRIDPRATTKPLHPALCAGVGGPLAVKVGTSDSGRASSTAPDLLNPHVVGYVSLDAAASQQLGPGQLATVKMASASLPLGEWLLHKSREWLTSEFHRNPATR